MHYPVNNAIRTSPFGMRGSEFHNGTDWISSDHNLYAVTSGVVIQKGWDQSPSGQPLGGNFIKIRFDYIDNRTFDGSYYHMERESHLNVGDRVGEGVVVGRMGKSGLATGVHLHKSITLDGRYVDPELFLDVFRQAEDDEIIYRVFHAVFGGTTPSKEDVLNFRRAGFPWRSEFERVKTERHCQ